MTKKNILSDHKKIGKKLIPPFLHTLGNLESISWLEVILPEIVWIGLMQEKLGIRRSVEICGVIAQSTKEMLQEQKKITLAFMSNFKKLNELQCKQLTESLKLANSFSDFQNALMPLVVLYPCCPLNKLLIVENKKYVINDLVTDFKNIFDKYFYRRSHLTNVMESTALYMTMVTGKILYCNNAKPPNLNIFLTESITSELYNKTASSVRAQITSLARECDLAWSNYFWNRGFIIDRFCCKN